jgi:hypothetical protein
MHQNGTVYTRSCVQCHLPYLVLNHQIQCPVCQFVSKLFCRGCGAYLDVSDATLTLGRRYCEQCVSSKRAQRQQRRRTRSTPARVVRAATPSSTQAS